MLDKRHPDWHQKIDLERLDMGHGQTCMLGQLYGDFSHGARSLHLTDDRIRECGFHASAPLLMLELLAYELLDQAWIAEIRKRLSADAVAKAIAEIPQEPFHLVA